jgi:hypothetical protein
MSFCLFEVGAAIEMLRRTKKAVNKMMINLQMIYLG